MNFTEFQYLKELIQYRIDTYFNKETKASQPVMPIYKDWELLVPDMFIEADLSEEEKTVLLLVLCPHVYSNLLDSILQDKLSSTGDFPQLGGVRGKNYRGFLPTGETALFITAIQVTSPIVMMVMPIL